MQNSGDYKAKTKLVYLAVVRASKIRKDPSSRIILGKAVTMWGTVDCGGHISDTPD